MKNKCPLTKMIICTLLLLVVLYFLYSNFFSSKEGVIFTPFDNRTLFTKPWNDFCIPTAPSCQPYFLEKPGMIGVFPVGCHCKGVGKAKSPPDIDEKCYEIDHDHFYH